MLNVHGRPHIFCRAEALHQQQQHMDLVDLMETNVTEGDETSNLAAIDAHLLSRYQQVNQIIIDYLRRVARFEMAPGANPGSAFDLGNVEDFSELLKVIAEVSANENQLRYFGFVEKDCLSVLKSVSDALQTISPDLNAKVFDGSEIFEGVPLSDNPTVFYWLDYVLTMKKNGVRALALLQYTETKDIGEEERLFRRYENTHRANTLKKELEKKDFQTRKRKAPGPHENYDGLEESVEKITKGVYLILEEGVERLDPANPFYTYLQKRKC